MFPGLEFQITYIIYWISNNIHYLCHGLFCIEWFQVRGDCLVWYWLNYWPLFEISFHISFNYPDESPVVNSFCTFCCDVWHINECLYDDFYLSFWFLGCPLHYGIRITNVIQQFPSHQVLSGQRSDAQSKMLVNCPRQERSTHVIVEKMAL